jgi:hypothetical protein
MSGYECEAVEAVGAECAFYSTVCAQCVVGADCAFYSTLCVRNVLWERSVRSIALCVRGVLWAGSTNHDVSYRYRYSLMCAFDDVALQMCYPCCLLPSPTLVLPTPVVSFCFLLVCFFPPVWVL